MLVESLPSIVAILSGFLAAIIYAVGGYLKNTPPEEFDEAKFFTTIIIGIVVGGTSAILGVANDAALQILASAGMVAYIEVWGKVLYRKLKERLS